MDFAAKALMATALLNGSILAIDLLYNIYHSLFPL